MVVPIDDHMVHRGHAVFDTANVKSGKVYGLDFHLDRLLKSAKAARIDHVPSKDWMKHVVLHTVASTGRRDGIFVRYWLSCCRGDFLVSPSRCPPIPSFYCMVHEGGSRDKALLSHNTGIREALVSAELVPHKPKLLANTKTNNYLLNALTAMAAEDRGGALGIGVDSEGNITEQATACVAFLCKDCENPEGGVLRVPPFSPILEGTTLQRALELVQPIPDVFSGRVEADKPVPALETLASCSELVSFGGGALLPIVAVDVSSVVGSASGSEDGQPPQVVVIGDGKPGPFFKAINEATSADFEHSEFLDDIPYPEA